jgi:alcohol dehydrogenase (cytochrome c)
MRNLVLAGVLAALLPSGLYAQTAQELVNGANDTSDVLNYGMGYKPAAFQPAHPDQSAERQAAGSGLELQL